MTSEKWLQKFPTDEMWLPNLVGALVMQTTNKKHYPGWGSNASSVWNLCGHCSDFISPGNWWWSEMLALYSGQVVDVTFAVAKIKAWKIQACKFTANNNSQLNWPTVNNNVA